MIWPFEPPDAETPKGKPEITFTLVGVGIPKTEKVLENDCNKVALTDVGEPANEGATCGKTVKPCTIGVAEA